MFLVHFTEPEQPGEIQFVARTTSSLLISWTQQDGVSDYTVGVDGEDSAIPVVYNLGGDAWNADISSLSTAGKEYLITVTPYNGEWSGVAQTTQQRTGAVYQNQWIYRKNVSLAQSLSSFSKLK